jgi:hypothetical protein
VRDFTAFKEAVGKRETGGFDRKKFKSQYDVVNSFGFLGKYQMGKLRLYDLGYSIDGWKPKGQPIKMVLSKDEFLNSPTLQESLFKKHVLLYKNYALKKHSAYLGRVTYCVYITLSGLIAGAHLMGWGNKKNPGVNQFLSDGIISKDGYGTPITEYIKKFAGYRLDENEPKIDLTILDSIKHEGYDFLEWEILRNRTL